MPVPALICFCQTSQSALKIISLNLSSPDPVRLFYLMEYSQMYHLIDTGGSPVFALIRFPVSRASPGLTANDT
jgi:hypothetical protein